MISRRHFIVNTSALAAGAFLLPHVANSKESSTELVKQCGPASKYTPTMMAAFVRRKGEYGMRWPGQIYDGKAAFKKYHQQITKTAKNLNVNIQIRPEPIHSLEEADAWVAQATAQKPDGLMVITLDRQEHAWPTVNKAIDSQIPTVVFSPLGTSFTTNTAAPSQKEGVFICSTDDFSQAAFGMKMIHAAAKLRETRFLIIKGDERKESEIGHLGTKLQYVPARVFIAEYNNVQETPFIKKLAQDLILHARHVHGPSKQDVINGVKSYLVAKNLLEREGCDGISMDCLGVLSDKNISLPCIAWSRMNDHAVPAACEADLEACVTHALVQYLFDRPGFQQDPVAETAKECLIGSHCCCPTRLQGFAESSEPYEIVPHHGKRDATAKPEWRIGQRITVADLLLKSEKNEMIISAGEVVENKSVPPSGGCVVAPMVKLDNVNDVLDYPGFHQIFFYGDFKKELKSYCQLFGITPRIV